MNEKKYKIPYEQALNSSQLDAVIKTEGPILVIAGAGSGKTRTLTYRVARLVEEGISPSSILLMTFTRKAADEMLKRACQLLDDRCEKTSGGTFHSFANMVLRRNAASIGFDQGFSIIDRPDSESLINMLRKEMGFVTKYRSFPRKRTLATIFSKAVNKVLPIEEVIFNDYSHFTPFLDGIMELQQAYGKRKAEHSFLDFDDLLVCLRQALREQSDLRDRLTRQYRYIMVDEYQDTNQIQADIIYLLVGPEKNIMVVGDDSQSIYAFRGANFKNIINFPAMFPGTQIIRLEENYRSVQPVLDLANIIIDRAEEKYTKTLFTSKSGGLVPSLITAADENNQSRFIVNKLLELEKMDISPNQIAVLFRAGFHSFDLEIELNRMGISFIKVGGFKFMESAHIKDVLAHLRIFANPYDRISWYRILLLIEKIGPRSAQQIFDAIVSNQSGYGGIFSIAGTKGYAAGLDRLKRLLKEIHDHPFSVTEMGEHVLKYYVPILKATYDDYPKRLKDLEQVLVIMSRYTHLESFLTDMALEPPNTGFDDSFAPDREDNNQRLTLSTIHSAKGLEWHTVFIIWALDGRFPSVQSMEKPEDLEEELRLMYVASTRAKENLYYICPMAVYDRHTGLSFGRPSRFIDGIPEEHLQRIYI